MKKYLFIILSLFCISLNIIPAYAYNDVLIQIDIKVEILEDGTAVFEEKWITEVGSGTENYKVFNNMEDSVIYDFTVIDEDGHQFTNIGSWDVDKSRQWKEYKCGIIQRDDDYELCWGVGDYGYREYTISYKISNFVVQYSQDQGINYTFLSNMDLAPKKVTIDLYSSIIFNEDNSDIYAYGYDGEVIYNDGHIVMNSFSSLSSYDKVQLLMRIDNDTFQCSNIPTESFDDILEEANEDSDYYDDYDEYDDYYPSRFNTVFFMIMIVFNILITFVPWILIFVMLRKNHAPQDVKDLQFVDNLKITKRELKQSDMYRDIPCDKNLYYFYYTAMKSGIIKDKDKSGLIAAVLLKWVKEGQIQFRKTDDQGIIFKKAGFMIDLSVPIQTSCSVEEELLSMLRSASGRNLLLETNEFEKWCRKYYSRIDSWFDRVDSYVESWMVNQNLIDKKLITTGFIFKRKKLNKIYNYNFMEEMKHVYGFKKFLKEMSSIHEKQVIEVKLWEEYLIFATILGIADEVEDQLKISCPEFNEVSHMDTIHTTRIMRSFTYNSYAAARRAQSAASSGGSSRSSGGGGHSSHSGGGSHSRGGGGGGRR